MRLDVVCGDGPPVFEARRTLFDALVEADIEDRYVPEQAVVVPVEALPAGRWGAATPLSAAATVGSPDLPWRIGMPLRPLGRLPAPPAQ
ncbi:hypothetical protein Esi_0144_0035 [Ectocarpus siliculosus]|uniref:Uncharacterized protein n=1 Tax=Ectocarpus siliculosus TaxID=2880 RepID=D7FKH3_ECTSI|nr:hypothetical protein Esi_0144_0035 [Ectocarpus siliculosus]|eukprot:CBJ29375.1 hypothetical protein Esi_0144_0035 [Ectocarpus siliculosus]